VKVLLINAGWGRAGKGRRRYKRAWPPLDLLNTAALLRKHDHDPVLLDLRADPDAGSRLAEQSRRADLVIFQTTPLDRWQCPDLNIEQLPGMVKDLPQDKLVMAGVHGTLDPAGMLEAAKAKTIIRGEPEKQILALAQAGGKAESLPDAAYLGADGFHEGRQPAPLDMAGLPVPAYDLIDPQKYRYPLLGDRLAVLETSRGCPYDCRFCLKTMYGQGVRYKPLDAVLADVEYAIGRQGFKKIYFMDLEFTINRDRIIDLCGRLASLRLDFQWCCQTRVDQVDPDLLAVMVKAGCRLIHFGVESGSPRLLSDSGKGITTDQAEKALSWCRQAKIQTACFFLFGLPSETPEDRQASINLARRLNPDYVSFHVAAPYLGTALALDASVETAFNPCLPEHNLDVLGRVAGSAMAGFYLRPRYIWNRLVRHGLKGVKQQLALFRELAR
jgi:anaerobic magnesium-protoporphyrin IX monomethyl ester cyclase